MASGAGDPPPFKHIRPKDLGIGLLFDAIRDAVVVSDAHGRIVLWNRGAETIFGHSRAEAEGQDVSILIPERYRAQHDEGMRRYAATGHGRLIDTHLPVELPAIRHNGEEIAVELTLAPLEVDGTRYALAVLRDVTDRVRLRQDLERRTHQQAVVNAALSRANESLTAFTYVVSHDLKEPVRAIDTYLRLLKEDHGPNLSNDAHDLLERARVATSRLSALLRGLLELSRADRAEMEARPLDVADVLNAEACRGVYDDLLKERGGSLEAAPGPRALAAPSILCQVLGNLVLNAVKHNPSRPPIVRVTTRLEGEYVEVHVDDNGPGVPPEVLERFNRAGEPGTLRQGFGLLIARRAVERLGGRMWLSSSKQLGGASVRFTLPAAGPAAGSASPQ